MADERTSLSKGPSSVKSEADSHVWTIEEVTQEFTDVQSLLRKKGCAPGAVIGISFNPRLTKSCGRTRRIGPGVFEIDFSVAYFQHASPISIRNTIAHEAIHTIPGCLNHGAKFKRVARLLAADGYQVSTRNRDKAYKSFREQECERKPVYYIFCSNCGKTLDKYKRLSPTLKTIMQSGQNSFCCPACKSLKLKVIKKMPDGTEVELKSIRI